MSRLGEHRRGGAARLTADLYSRRRFLIGAGAAAAAATFLAACGGDSNDDPEPTETETATGTGIASAATSATATSTSDASTSSSGAPFPVTVAHKYGETEIAEEPSRVLSLGYTDHDSLLAVGVTPIATRYWFGEEPGAIFPWAQDRLTGETPEVLEMLPGELDFEAIAALQPDLIVAVYSGITAEEYATLTAIAPVVAQSPDYIDYGMPWDEAGRLIATALGKVDEMETLIADVEAQYSTALQAHPEFEGKQMVVAAMRADGQVGVYAEQDGRVRVFANLGFGFPDELRGLFGETFYANISPEQFNLLDSGDVVAWTQVDYTSPEAILENDVYRQLSVAREGRHILISGYADMAFSFNSVLSLPYAIDAVVPSLAAALDGDPATNVEVAVA